MDLISKLSLLEQHMHIYINKSKYSKNIIIKITNLYNNNLDKYITK